MPVRCGRAGGDEAERAAHGGERPWQRKATGRRPGERQTEENGRCGVEDGQKRLVKSSAGQKNMLFIPGASPQFA